MIIAVSYTHLDVYKRQTWEGTRPRGRPRKRWEDGVAEDARDMGIRNWRRVAVDRLDWRRRFVEARARLGL